MINNRQNGRRRGRGGQRPGGGGGGGGNAGQSNGSRIDNRARGNASQLYEKYKTLALDAQRQGDRVNTEYYLQFADHYFRVLSENRPREEQRARQRDDFDDDFDGNGGDEFGSEGEPVRADQYQPSPDRARDDQRDEERGGRVDRDERRPQVQQRADGGRPDGNRPETGRGEGNRGDGIRGDGNRSDRGPRPERDDRRPRGLNGGDAPRRNAPEANGHAVEPATTTQPDPALEGASAPHLADMEAPEPRRRGRPRRERPADEVGADAPAETFEADRLPPSLSISASAEPETVASDEAQAEKPRRRRRATPVVGVTPAE